MTDEDGNGEGHRAPPLNPLTTTHHKETAMSTIKNTNKNIYEMCPGLETAENPYAYAHGYLRSAMQSLETSRTIFANDPQRFYAHVDMLLKQARALDAALKETLANRG